MGTYLSELCQNKSGMISLMQSILRTCSRGSIQCEHINNCVEKLNSREYFECPVPKLASISDIFFLSSLLDSIEIETMGSINRNIIV